MSWATFFQILTAIGLFTTAIGGVGTHVANKKEVRDREEDSKRRIVEVETAVKLAADRNADIIKEFTKEAMEESTKMQIRAQLMMEARKKYDERMKKIGSRQQRAVSGR